MGFGLGLGLWGSGLDLKAPASAATSRASLAGPCRRKQLLIRGLGAGWGFRVP